VAVAEKREEDQLERLALADDRLLNLGEDRLSELPQVGKPGQSDSTASIAAAT
jgi:hypothetical protein